MLAKNVFKALQIDLALIFLKGNASGYRVAIHIIVNKYILAYDVGFKGPTKSIWIF